MLQDVRGRDKPDRGTAAFAGGAVPDLSGHTSGAQHGQARHLPALPSRRPATARPRPRVRRSPCRSALRRRHGLAEHAVNGTRRTRPDGHRQSIHVRSDPFAGDPCRARRGFAGARRGGPTGTAPGTLASQLPASPPSLERFSPDVMGRSVPPSNAITASRPVARATPPSWCCWGSWRATSGNSRPPSPCRRPGRMPHRGCRRRSNCRHGARR